MGLTKFMLKKIVVLSASIHLMQTLFTYTYYIHTYYLWRKLYSTGVTEQQQWFLSLPQ